MTYTAEQLRRDAIAIERMHGETLTVEWRGHQASQLRAHADLLDWKASIEAAQGEDVQSMVASLQHKLMLREAAILESLSVKLAEREAELKFWKDDSKEERCRAHDANRRAEKAEAEVARLKRLDRRVHSIVEWLERNQEDVFRRGLWDAIREADQSGDFPEDK